MRCSEKEAWWHHQRICSARDAFTTLPEFRARLYKLQADVNALLTTLEQLEDKGFQVEEVI
uniref:Uncharacterized protein n=1 Tax=Tetraselmis sp. GSL018 TaxID=582737 RepID=A0A061R7R2_9CHLO|eukprot:CAMPEP_0177599060 /NCGR_PEP_ID=MMETSP0419_2-20121207/12757_1 /TAXON_ID=582737 /ORGANISM="Tetraselmis sp., Strain GSL018" /LENGTH=60 /DNA_ID=CAMNT_0019091699 /DNA_START=407 /DNA_END=589 /DNA_ORIENTATION=+